MFNSCIYFVFFKNNNIYRKEIRYAKIPILNRLYKKAIKDNNVPAKIYGRQSIFYIKNKPLLVIGDPNNGFTSKILGLTYPCGDLCLDIVGCKGCKNQIEGDALQELKKMKDNSYIIFESCVLEYIQYNKLVREEILRVSGNKYFEVRIGLSLINLGYYPGGLLTNESTKIYSVE